MLLALGGALVHTAGDRGPASGRCLHQAFDCMLAAGARTQAAEAAREIAFVHVQLGHRERADAWLDRAEELADDPVVQAKVCGVRGMNRSDAGQYAAALAACQRAVGLADGAAARPAAWALSMIGRVALLRGDAATAAQVLARAEDLVARERWTAFAPWVDALRAEAAVGLGDTSTAGMRLERAYALARTLGDHCWIAMTARPRRAAHSRRRLARCVAVGGGQLVPPPLVPVGARLRAADRGHGRGAGARPARRAVAARADRGHRPRPTRPRPHPGSSGSRRAADNDRPAGSRRRAGIGCRQGGGSSTGGNGAVMTRTSGTTKEISARVHEVRGLREAEPQLRREHDPAVRVERIGPLQFRAVDDAGWAVCSDLPALVGGTEEHPTPGTLLRAALGCCDATALALEAAARGIELSRLEVAVDSESDRRGLLGVAGAEAGPLSMHASYRLASPNATDDDLRAVLEHSLRHSPVLSALRREVRVLTTVQLG